MPQQVLDRGKTFISIRVPAGEVEALRLDIDTRLQNQEYMVMEAQDGDHMILIVTLISTTLGGQKAIDQMVERYGDTSSVQAVADNPAISKVEIDF